MGYNVRYRLEIDVRGQEDKDRDYILFQLRKNPNAKFALDDTFSTLREHQKPARDVVFGNGEGSWDGYEEEMRKFSGQWSGVLFTMTADGEEQGDLTVTYFFEGRMQKEKQTPWEPPPFDLSKLR